jgi:hypothetical protein
LLVLESSVCDTTDAGLFVCRVKISVSRRKIPTQRQKKSLNGAPGRISAGA